MKIEHSITLLDLIGKNLRSRQWNGDYNMLTNNLSQIQTKSDTIKEHFFHLTVLFRDLNKWVTGLIIMLKVKLFDKSLVSIHMKENPVPMVGRGIPMPHLEI